MNNIINMLIIVAGGLNITRGLIALCVNYGCADPKDRLEPTLWVLAGALLIAVPWVWRMVYSFSI